MNELIFINSEQSIASTDIDEIELNYQIFLAEDYKKLILRFNGGRPNKTLYEGEGEALIFGELFPVKYGNFRLEDALDKFCSSKILPQSLIPIGADPADNLICLSQEKLNFGKVYIWMHDSGKSLRYIASSLHEVLSGLTEFEW